MIIARKLLIFVLFLLLSGNVLSYTQDTHRELSKAAVGESVLAAPVNNILLDLGLSSDITLNSTQKFPNSEGDLQSIGSLIEDGAEFEDEVPRFLHHFYDPRHDVSNDGSLDHPLVSFFTQASPDWALEDISDFTAQDYSYSEALTFFHLALGPGTQTDRDTKWGETFESLGHMIHHLQDMAQPEHVRNDLHCSALICAFLGLWDKSLFESRSKKVFVDGIPSALINYPGVSFPTPREFWTTRGTDPAVVDRRGIADFTNRNFISKDTNFKLKNGLLSPNSQYDLPVPSPITTKVSLAALLPNNGEGAALCQNLNIAVGLPANSPCEIEFIANTVTDSFVNPPQSVSNDRAAVLSIYDQYLAKYNVSSVAIEEDGFYLTDVDRLTTINRFTVEAAHTHLIPRAVAYGAGLIDHFFRGKIDMIPNPGSSSYIIQNLGTEDMDGTFKLYYDDVSDERHEVFGASWSLQILAGGQSAPVSFTEPTNPPPKMTGEYMLVFDGDMGAVQAGPGTLGNVAAKQVGLYWEPWGTTLTDYHDWLYQTDSGNDGNGPAPPPIALAPVDGVLSIDTRVVPERGLNFCTTYFPPPDLDIDDCAVDGNVYSVVFFEGSETITANTARIRLKVDSFYQGGNPANCENGRFHLYNYNNGNFTNESIIEVQIWHDPNATNTITRLSQYNWYIANNGSYWEYEIPLDDIVGPIDSLALVAEDYRVEDIDLGPSPCEDAYFALDIDYIHFY